MNTTDRFALIAERAQVAEQYIKDQISKETFYAEMDRLDKLLAA